MMFWVISILMDTDMYLISGKLYEASCEQKVSCCLKYKT